MKDKILSFLKTKLADYAGGVEKTFLLEYAEYFSNSITEESQIATTITDGVIDQIKVGYGAYNKEVVNKTTEAQETALKNFRKKHGLDENGKSIETGNQQKKSKDVDPEEPAWFKSYRETKDAELAEVKAKLENQEKEKARMSLTEKVKSHEKLKGIPASFLKKCNLTPESEGEIDQLVASVESDWNTLKQETAEQGVHISVPPAGGSGIKEGAALGKMIAEKKNTNTSDGVKGKAI